MKLKDFFDNPFEFFWGFCAQFPIILVIDWWAVPVMALCSVLWRLGGVKCGNKMFRRIGVPLVICGSTFAALHQFGIFMAVPFMIWACPWSYGEDSWLYKAIKGVVADQKKTDFYTRSILFAWYWFVFEVALGFKF